MKITKEALEKQLDVVKTNMDGYMQGYVSALSFVSHVLDTPDVCEIKETEPVKELDSVQV